MTVQAVLERLAFVQVDPKAVKRAAKEKAKEGELDLS